MPEDKRSELVGWLYDDMCHLKPFSGIDFKVYCWHNLRLKLLEKIKQEQSAMTKVFASLKKAVDKLHFRGHRGEYCLKNCDPFKIKELEGVNTPVCEQTFSW